MSLPELKPNEARITLEEKQEGAWLEFAEIYGKSYQYRGMIVTCEIGRRCSIGPFAYLREGTNLKDDVVIGVFTEIKNSTIGSNTVARHLAYIGDAQIGQRVNVGAGTIFANYDGTNVSDAKIEDDVFIGSGVTLISPVNVGSGTHLNHGQVVDHLNQGK